MYLVNYTTYIIYTLYTWLSVALESQTIPEELHMAGRGDSSQLNYFMNLLSPNQMWRITVTRQDCHHLRLPLQTIGKGNIEQQIINPNTMSTL